MGLVFFVAWEFALLLAPLLGWAFRRRFSQMPVGVKKAAISILFLLPILAALQYFTHWSLRGLLVASLLYAAAYTAYAQIPWLLTLIQPKWVAWTVASVAGLTLVPGILTGTVGCLGLMFISDSVTPRTVLNLTPNLVYRATLYGGAWSSHDGADVGLWWHPRFFPFIEHKVFSHTFQDDACDFAKVSARVDGKSREIVLYCPAKNSPPVVVVYPIT